MLFSMLNANKSINNSVEITTHGDEQAINQSTISVNSKRMIAIVNS